MRKILPFLLLPVLAMGAYWILAPKGSDTTAEGLDPAMASMAPEEGLGPTSHLVASQELGSEGLLQGQGSTAQRQSALATGPRIEIRVTLPEGSPFDPTLRVVALPHKAVRSGGGRKPLDALALGQELDYPWSAAPVGADGLALLAIDPSIEKPCLVVDGEFLYLKRNVPVEGLDPVQLHPELGASLSLTMTTPDGLQPEGEVRLMGANMSGQTMGFSSRISSVSQGLFRGLAPNLNWMVLPQLEQHFTHGKLGVKLSAGERRHIQLDLILGCLVEGTVVDDDGQPIPKITVSLVNKQPWARMLSKIEAKTDEQGHFTLGRMGPGTQTLEARKQGRLTAKSPELDLVDGEVRGGVQLVLSLGATISGTVYGPDGAPARKVQVTASRNTRTQRFRPGMPGRNSSTNKATSDKLGHFEITGLQQEKYSIKARKGGRGSLGGKANLRAALAAVEAGVSGIRLDLEAPHILTGRVVDEQDQAVTAFRIRGKSVESGGPEESESFESEDGTFQFEKLGEGRWDIKAKAEGFHQEANYTVLLPRGDGPLVIVLQRESSIAGQVLAPDGSPMPGAIVRADSGEGRRSWGPNRGPRADADKQGNYTLEGLAPGAYHIVASAQGWADSAQTTVEITPGLEAQGVVLQLRTGGSISGLVLEADGSPMAGRRVHWGENAMGFGNRDETKTDSAGRFKFKNVTPGEWQVSAAPSFEEMGDRMQGRSGAEVMGVLMDGLLTKTVQVFERENTHVELGGDPKAPIKITGRVLHHGQPVEGAEVYAVTEGKAIVEGMKSTKSASDGSFELILDRPDSYVFSARSKALGMEVLVDVPAATQWNVDLIIPSGGITGTVHNAEGKPTPGIRLSLQRNDGLGRIRWRGSQATTDVAGQYTFDGLEPGAYTVRANTATFGSGNMSLGSELREGLQVTDDGLQAADFHLQSPGSIKGSVRGPDGNPLAGVSIFFRDETGQLIKNLSRTQTDVAGKFMREGLTPGEYTVSARSAELACEDSKQILVREGKSPQIHLVLDHATVLWISLIDEQGTLQRLRSEVLDRNGVRVEGGMTPAVMRSSFRQGTSSSNQRVGPLPPGKYTVRGFTVDGRSAETEIRISGQEKEQSVSLQIK